MMINVYEYAYLATGRQKMKVAINIKTEDWNQIIAILKREGWKVRSKYRGIDEGIDYDYLVLQKKTDQITFGWTNYFEGEVQCSDNLFDFLEKKFELQFSYGTPTSLSPGFFTKEKAKGIGQWLRTIFK